MEWITIPKGTPYDKVRDFLPKDKVFIALWKGAICFCDYNDDDDHFYIAMQPHAYYDFQRVDHERERKFTHYCELKTLSPRIWKIRRLSKLAVDPQQTN